MPRVRLALESTWFPLVCVFAGLVLRVICVATFPVPPTSDFAFYFERAVDIDAGRGAVFNGEPTAYWPLGYSFFLAAIFKAVGPSLVAALAANVALSIASLFLVHWIARRLSGSREVAAIAVAVLAFHPNQIALCALTANETLATFLLLAGVALLLAARSAVRSWIWLAFAGFVFGLACLVKPQLVVVPIVCMTWMAWTHRQAKLRLLASLVLVYGLVAVTILPWMVRNARAFGHVVFIANTGGLNLYVGNNPLATGGYPDHQTERLLAATIHTFGNNEFTIDRVAGRKAVEYISAHPFRVLALVPSKIWHLYAKDYDGFSWIGEASNGAHAGVLVALKLWAELYYLLLMTLFVAALAWPRRGRFGVRAPDRMPLVIISAMTLVYVVYFGSGRYHFPFMPWIAIYSAAFLAEWITVRAAARAPIGCSLKPTAWAPSSSA